MTMVNTIAFSFKESIISLGSFIYILKLIIRLKTVYFTYKLIFKLRNVIYILLFSWTHRHLIDYWKVNMNINCFEINYKKKSTHIMNKLLFWCYMYFFLNLMHRTTLWTPISTIFHPNMPCLKLLFIYKCIYICTYFKF